ncbi:MAG: histidine ammonia-lyase [Deltaproteobacteria bacterium]|nr:histidine ammonia-lyase [Deltaproteobacteria bacterium]
MKNKIFLDGEILKLSDVEKVSLGGAKVSISPQAISKIQNGRKFIENIIDGKHIVYGVNTGFGHLSNKKIKNNELAQLQKNLIRSHCTGIGNICSKEVVRAMMLLRANTLAKGNSGVRLEVIEKIIELLNKDTYPIIYEQGSVGASGDLAPLAQLALCLIGEGEFLENGAPVPAKKYLSKKKIKPLVLYAKEGISLINGTQQMTAVGALCIEKAKRLLKIADIAGAMSLEAVKGSHKAFDEDIMRVRPHPGALECAANFKKLLKKSHVHKSHKKCEKIQDAYSLRCIPQVHGAVRDVLSFSEKILSIELNSAVDNPLIFPDKNKVLSCGNFHGQPIAYALDSLSIALTGISNISERRIEKIMNPAYSELPPFLSKHPGLESGLMMVQVSAAALASENKVHAAPASVDTIPTSMDKEDHVSMGPIAAFKLEKIVNNIEKILSMEILCSYLALHWLTPLKAGVGVDCVFQFLKDKIPDIYDRPFNKDFLLIQNLIQDNSLLKKIEKKVGALF